MIDFCLMPSSFPLHHLQCGASTSSSSLLHKHVPSTAPAFRSSVFDCIGPICIRQPIMIVWVLKNGVGVGRREQWLLFTVDTCCLRRIDITTSLVVFFALISFLFGPLICRLPSLFTITNIIVTIPHCLVAAVSVSVARYALFGLPIFFPSRGKNTCTSELCPIVPCQMSFLYS